MAHKFVDRKTHAETMYAINIIQVKFFGAYRGLQRTASEQNPRRQVAYQLWL